MRRASLSRALKACFLLDEFDVSIKPRLVVWEAADCFGGENVRGEVNIVHNVV